MANQYTVRTNMLWIQPDGPGGAIYPLECADLDELKEVETAIETLKCWNADRSGFDTIGELIGPAENISFTLTLPEFQARSLLETVNCPFTLYWTQSLCGRVDDFSNIDRGEVVQHIRRTGRAFNAVAKHDADGATNLSIDVTAWPKLLDIDALLTARITTVETMILNDVIGNDSQRCIDDCGATVNPGQRLYIACDSAPAAATGDVLYSSDYGETWAATATDPFAAGKHVKSITKFSLGQNVTRVVVGEDGLAGGAFQGHTAYSDDRGTTWTVVNIGGAAAQHGTMRGHCLWSEDRYHVWAACNLGYIYKSIDGAQSWVAKESGVIHAGSYLCIHFADKTYGMAGGAAGVIARTQDGGETWTAGGIPAASPCNFVWMFDKNICLAGLANGALYRSTDGGLTWTLQVTGFAAGVITSGWFVNQYQGFIAHETAAPVGSLYMTNNGGATWVPFAMAGMLGANSVWAANGHLAIEVGDVVAGTGYIGKADRAYV
jgi:photosystem II stability/assembly factor-like uncharacterized protein